jgi:hypothetical protein
MLTAIALTLVAGAFLRVRSTRSGTGTGARRYARGVCNWTCYPYWRPYQYYYWQFYYPYGGPHF